MSSASDARPGRRLVLHALLAPAAGRRRSASASRNRRHATVTSQPFGSRGGSSGHTRTASTSASWTASSAAAKSAPRRTRTPEHGRDDGPCSRALVDRGSTAGHSVTVGRLAVERAQLEPLVDRLAAGPRRRRQLPGQLERPLVAVDVDDHPAGDQVLGLGERAVGDRRPALAVVADPRAVHRQRLAVDELAGAPRSRSAKSCHVLDVRRDLLRRPPVHRLDVVDSPSGAPR